MCVRAKTVAIKYRAFVTCSHRDKRWGKWLHAALESYRIDRDLAGRSTSAGRVPQRLRPIFRDCKRVAPDCFPSEERLAALRASRFLIVICSPSAAKSRYVNEEIRRFKAMRRADRIIPVIVAGEPGDLDRECFPPALRYKIGPDGVLTWEYEELIAADARPNRDGKEIVKQKVLAGLLGVGLDEVIWRAKWARERRNRVAEVLTGVFLMVCAAAGASVAYAWRQVQTDDAFLNAALTLATQVVSTAVDQAERYKVPRSATLGLLGTAERVFDDMSRHRTATKELRYRKAWMLMEFARNYEMLGKTEDQRARGEGAHRFMLGLAGQDQSNTGWQADLFATYNKIGDILARQGALDEAIASYRTTLAIIERIAAADVLNLQWQRNLSLTYFILGSIFFEQGTLDGALDNYRRSLAVSERIASNDAPNSDWQGDLADIHIAMGHVFGAQNRLADALGSYRTSAVVLERLAARHPTHTLWRSQLAYTRYEIGNLFRRQGAYKEALKNYREYLAAMKHLVSADRDNGKWQEQLWRAYCKVGDMLFELGAPEDALKSYRESLLINERFHAEDPNNTNVSRDLALLYAAIGDVLENNGSYVQAALNYRNGLAIMEQLAIKHGNARDVLDSLDFHSRLAALGDDPLGRLTRVVTGLRKLRNESRLTPAQANWLQAAESQLAKLGRVSQLEGVNKTKGP